MANVNDGVRESIEQENPAVPSPPRETAIVIPPPLSIVDLARKNLQSLITTARCVFSTPQERVMCLQWLFNLMTSSSEAVAAPFRQVISSLNEQDVVSLASLLTSHSDYYFLEMARNVNGCNSLLKLLGRSVEADEFLAEPLLRCLCDFMTDTQASYFAVQGMRVFSRETKTKMCRLIHLHAIPLACNPRGCIALNAIIAHEDDVGCRDYLLDIVAHNALLLSCDVYGNFVVQRVLQLNDVRCTWNVAVSLRGKCVELSFQRYGSYIVSKLLETESSRYLVVTELLGCEGHRLMWLASSEFGGFVVDKALRTLTRGDLQLWVLVSKLMPFLHLLRISPARTTVAAFLESI